MHSFPTYHLLVWQMGEVVKYIGNLNAHSYLLHVISYHLENLIVQYHKIFSKLLPCLYVCRCSHNCISMVTITLGCINSYNKNFEERQGRGRNTYSPLPWKLGAGKSFGVHKMCYTKKT